MASLRDAVKDNANELRDGIPWVVFWREGRSWHSEAVFFSMDYAADTIDPDDIGRLEHISRTDPRAVALNGYYCGHLGEDMTLDELTSGVRWHYENGFNTLAAFIENHDGRLPPELLEEARQAAHAAGLPFSERPYDGQELDPYSYDGSMTPEDYELWQQLIAQERSAKMNDPLSLQIHNRQRFEQNEPGEWLKLPATAEQLQETLRRVGITAENRQDFLINGIETSVPALQQLPLYAVRSAGIDELNHLAARLEAFDPAQMEKLNAAINSMIDVGDIRRFAECTENMDFYDFHPGIADSIQLGEYTLEHSGLIQIPDEWAAAIDLDKLGELAAENEKGIFTEYGYIVPNGSDWKSITEIPQEYRIMSFPQPEPSHDDPIDYDAISTRAPAVATTPAPELAAVPQPVKPIVLESETAADKLKEITDKLEHGIAGIFESEQYADYLKTLSKFHNYSLNNTILIAMQKPDASHVAGFNTWKNEFERNVCKGEKGIKIIAPSPFKVKKEIEKIDPDTQRPVMGADGKPITEEVEIKIPAYKVVSVFDVSQTEGKELPTIGVDELTGDVEQYRDFFAALEKTSPFSIAFEPIGGDTKGYANYEEKRIAIREGMSELQTLKTAIHEITHARLHDHINNEQEQPRADRRTREVQAESIAYTVCQHYGLDTSDYSFGYVAGWSGGKELAELKASLETIRTTAAGLITEIDGHFAELQKDREHTAEQEPPTPEQADSVFHRLPPEQQQALSDEVKATLQFFIDNDLKEHEELSDGTLEAIAVQGYAYRDGKLEKLAEPQPVQQEPPTEQQPGFEEWSEPATAENAPENPGTPSDDIDAYLTEQDNQPAQAATPTETKATYYTINEQAARRAKEAISYSDYRPGSATAEYRQSVDKAVEMAKRQKARVDPMYFAKIDGLLNTYARKLAENMNSGYSITARVPSILITGGGNFPVRRKEKQNAASDRNMQEWRDIQGLLDKIRSTGMGGISADDPNAVQKLQSKLAGLEKSQETMKAANAYYRKHKTLDGFPGLSSEQIQKLTASMQNRWYGRAATQPFEPYSLQNNNAEINRVKGRIAELTRKSETAFVGWQFEGGKVEANTQDNRLQIFFDGKPDEATRTELKGNGFKWAPSVGAWQRQLNNNAFFAANYVKSIQPLTGEKPTDLQRRARREATAPVQPEQQAAPEQERQQGDTYAIYQLRQDDSTRDFRFEPYDRLQAAGLTVDPANYVFIYAGQLGKDETLETIFERFNISHPEDFTGHSLSVSDVVTLNRDGKETAHYVDSFGYKEVPEFLNPAPAFDMQQTAAEPPVPDNFLTGEKIKTPRGSFSLTDMTPAQMEAAGYGFHHSSDDGRYHIMGNGTRAFAIINPLRTAEMSTEQNYNMIDGVFNNTPSVGELEARAKAGEQISLSDLAAAIKTDKAAAAHDTGKKPSIREQLKQTGADLSHKDKSAPSRTRDKNNYLEV